MLCIGAILHASVGTGPVKLFFPKDSMAVKKVKFLEQMVKKCKFQIKNLLNEDMRPISVGIAPVNILE